MDEVSQTLPNSMAVPEIPITAPELRQRPATSRTPRRRSRQESRLNTFRQRTRHVGYSIYDFGKDAPKITIGCSRQEPPAPPKMPGPGAYNPKEVDRTIKRTFPRSKSVDHIGVTAKIDFINYREYPNLKQRTIGKRDGHPFFNINDSPAPNFVPNYVPSRTHKIQTRKRERAIEDSPGPGEYDPSYGFLYEPIPIHFKHEKDRSGWLIDQKKNPGPGIYSPDGNVVKPHEPAYTIGGRSRSSRRKSRRGGRPKPNVIGIDVFVIKLDSTFDMDEVKRYIVTHPQLYSIVHEFMELVTRDKPYAPVGFIRDYFIEQKERMKKKNPRRKRGSLQNSYY